MKTTLAYIDKACSEVQEKPRFVTKSIAGFSMTVAESESSYRKESYSTSAKALRAMLKEAGIQPLAILPRQWWHDIVEATGLLDLAPTWHSTIRMDVRPHTRTVLRLAEWALIGFFLASWAAASAWLMSFGNGANNIITLTLTSALVGFAVTFIWSMLLVGTLRLAGIRIEGVLARWVISPLYILFKGEERLVREMVKSESHFRERWIPIALPTPPKDVCDILIKAEKLNHPLRVAAEYQAVSFAVPVSRLITMDLEEEIKERAIQREISADPIVYIENSNAVAIIAQFGDFPIEKEIVDQVVGRGL